jgi:hypothetical protein
MPVDIRLIGCCVGCKAVTATGSSPGPQIGCDQVVHIPLNCQDVLQQVGNNSYQCKLLAVGAASRKSREPTSHDSSTCDNDLRCLKASALSAVHLPRPDS